MQRLFRSEFYSEFEAMGKRNTPTGDATIGKRYAKKVCACVSACVACLNEP